MKMHVLKWVMQTVDADSGSEMIEGCNGISVGGVIV
jgi:hypothetical protein